MGGVRALVLAISRECARESTSLTGNVNCQGSLRRRSSVLSLKNCVVDVRLRGKVDGATVGTREAGEWSRMPDSETKRGAGKRNGRKCSKRRL